MTEQPTTDRLNELSTEYAETGRIISDGAVWLLSQVRVLREQVQQLRAAPAGQAPDTDRAALRERIAEALIRWTYRGQDPDPETGILDTVRANAYSRADAVLAVLPATADRADIEPSVRCAVSFPGPNAEALRCHLAHRHDGAHVNWDAESVWPNHGKASELRRLAAAPAVVSAVPGQTDSETTAIGAEIETVHLDDDGRDIETGCLPGCASQSFPDPGICYCEQPVAGAQQPKEA